MSLLRERSYKTFYPLHTSILHPPYSPIPQTCKRKYILIDCLINSTAPCRLQHQMSPVQLIRQLPLRRPLLLRGHTRWAEDTKVPGRLPRRWQRILLQENLPERWVGVNHYYDVPLIIGCFYKSEILYQLVEMSVGEYNARKWWKYHLIHNMIHHLVAATIILATV